MAQPTAAPPDFTDRLTRLLGPGETLLAHCRVVPGASGGERRGSIAAAFARADAPLVLSVSDVYLSLWDFGTTGTEQPALASQLPRQYVASFTGEDASVARMAFTDGSSVDWRLGCGPEFLIAAGFRR
ncbi:MAG TPA: hypothetical protein VGF17_24970 [Phytomonospora sp.]